MSRFCFCLIVVLVCCSTAEAQFRRFSRPRARQSQPLKNTTEMVGSVLAEEMTKVIIEGVVEEAIIIMRRASLQLSKNFGEVGHSQFEIRIEPDILRWTAWDSKLDKTAAEKRHSILFIPAAELSESDVAQLEPGAKRFIGAVGFQGDITDAINLQAYPIESLYTLPRKNDLSMLWADTPLLFLAITKTSEGKVRLLGYGAGSEAIVSTDLSKIVKPGTVDPNQTLGKPIAWEDYDALGYSVRRPATDEWMAVEHFFRGDIRQTEPLSLQISLFGKYQARF